jgi:glycosyltransferase involved in cell wall biosynthesis
MGSPRMNVLYLAAEPRIDLSHIAGHTTHILKTIKGLEEQGHCVHRIIAGERSSAKTAKQTFRKLKTRLPSSLSLVIRDAYALVHDRSFYRHCYSLGRTEKFAFIYERATPYHRTGLRLSKALGIPLILEMNSPLEELVNLYGCSRMMILIASFLEKLTAMKAHAVVVGSRNMRRYLVGKGVSAEKIFVIYPTADDHFLELSPHQAKVREKYGLQSRVVVGFVGSMARYHRVDLLLRAAAQISQIAAHISFLIVGDGEKSVELKSFAREHSLEDRVVFTGRVPYEQIPDFCGAMDICVIPHAEWYGSPTKLFEYAAAGKAVIAPAIGPIEELIRDGENGLLTKLADVDDLVAKILTLAGDPALRLKLGINLKQEIVSEHTLSKTTDQLLQIFSMLVHGQSPVRPSFS